MPWTWYTRQLAARPYLTRSVVAATLMGSGDAIAQQFFETKKEGKGHDLTRTGRFAVYGFVFHAPILAQWFKLVDKVPFQSKGRAVVTKVIMDQTLWGPFSCTMFFSVMSLMEGHTVHEAIEKVQVGFWPVYIRGAAVFLPTAALTYSVIPLAHRGLFLQAVGLGWNTYLSAANSKANDQVAELDAEHLAHSSKTSPFIPKTLPASVSTRTA